ncbi:MAG TPA: glycosyltransferase [Acidimicrobiales bacterium]|nr:glycosyltransferase [Acidimicrobiales bacterium]
MRLDIVIPAFNEEDRIDRTLRAYRSVVTEPRTRFLVALDSCTDGTAAVVRSHAEVDPRVELMEYPKLGKGGVIMETFRRCDADVIGFVDADCATPPAEFLRLVAMTAEADGAIAGRHHPASVLPAPRPRGRRFTSWAFARFTRTLFGLPYLDTQCGAKAVRRQVIERALPLLSARDFLFDVDLLLTADRLGFDIVEVPTVWLDQEGSHLSAGADARRMAMSSLRLWLHHRVLPVPDDRVLPVREALPLPTEKPSEMTAA